MISINELKPGYIVLERCQYGPCVHKILTKPYSDHGMITVDTIDLDSLTPSSLGVNPNYGYNLELELLVSDGDKFDPQDMYAKAKIWLTERKSNGNS